MLQHGACQQQNKRASDTAQWLEQSQGHFTCLFVCCEKKVRLSEVKSLNLSLVCLRVFASFIGIAGAARTPSVGRRARTRLVVVSLNFRSSGNKLYQTQAESRIRCRTDQYTTFRSTLINDIHHDVIE